LFLTPASGEDGFSLMNGTSCFALPRWITIAVENLRAVEEGAPLSCGKNYVSCDVARQFYRKQLLALPGETWGKLYWSQANHGKFSLPLVGEEWIIEDFIRVATCRLKSYFTTQPYEEEEMESVPVIPLPTFQEVLAQALKPETPKRKSRRPKAAATV